MIGDGDGDSSDPIDSDLLTKEKALEVLQSIEEDELMQNPRSDSMETVAVPAENREKILYSSVLTEGSAVPDLMPQFVVKDGVAEVEVPVELLQDTEPLWRCCLVGYFMNDAPHIGSIHATLNRIWALPGKKTKIDVQFIG